MAYWRNNASHHAASSSYKSTEAGGSSVHGVGAMRGLDVEAGIHQSDLSNILDDDDDNSKHKPIAIFGYDITRCNVMIQYFILAGGLLVFMCMYGYFQELVQYGWFDRKLSIFSTFLHFACCSVFAEMQRQYMYSMHGDAEHDRADSAQGKLRRGGILTMGTASSRVALGYYFLLVCMKTLTQGFTNLAMTQINYPAKTLFKSANPIITMLIGIVWFRKTYPVRDYLVVLLLVIGLYLFINGDSSNANAMPSCTSLGIFYITVGMFGAASIPMIQEHCMLSYNATVEELLYHSFVGSTLMAFVLSVITGEFFAGVSFLLSRGDGGTWCIFVAFCTVGFIGANFGTSLTQRFGSLVNGITNTARKAVTLALSFLLFPERNHLTSNHILGAVVFFSGLVLRSFMKDKAHKTSGPSKLALGNGRFDKSCSDINDMSCGTLHSMDAAKGSPLERRGAPALDKQQIEHSSSSSSSSGNANRISREGNRFLSSYGNRVLSNGSGSAVESMSQKVAAGDAYVHTHAHDVGAPQLMEVPSLGSRQAGAGSAIDADRDRLS
jgi:hypothetical protein